MINRCPYTLSRWLGVISAAMLVCVCILAPASGLSEDGAFDGWRADGAPGSVWRLTERPSSLSATGATQPERLVRDLSIAGQTTIANVSEGIVIACERVRLSQDAASGLILSASVIGRPLTIDIEGREPATGKPSSQKPRQGFDSSRASRAIIGGLATYSDLSGSLVLTGGVRFFQPDNRFASLTCDRLCVRINPQALRSNAGGRQALRTALINAKATGNVILSDGEWQIECERFEYSASLRQARLLSETKPVRIIQRDPATGKSIRAGVIQTGAVFNTDTREFEFLGEYRITTISDQPGDN